ncbi:putative ribonuclease H-like domain-containing protein, partial [Tanacetum coccineum]
ECKDQEKEDNVNSTNNVNTVSSTINAAGTNEVNVVGGKTSIELSFNPNMPALEDDSIFDFSRDDEDDGAVADMNNLNTTIQVSPNPTIRIHKDHPLDQVIGDLQSATQTRKMSKNLEEHGKNLKRLVAQGYIQEEGIDYDEVFAPIARIEAIRLFLAYASFKDFVVYQMDVKSDFLYEKIEEEVYVFYVDDIIFGSTKKELCIAFEKLMHEKFQMSSMGELTFFLGLQVKQKKDGIFISQDKYVVVNLKKFKFTEVKTTSTPMETQKPLLKDEDGERSWMLYVRFNELVLSDVILHLQDLTSCLQCVPMLCKKQTVVANSIIEAEYVAASSCCGQLYLILLGKSKKSVKLMMGMLFGMELKLILAKTINEEEQLHALVDGKKIIITKSSVRRDLQLADEEDKVVHKELGDSLVWAATTASSLEAEQDRLKLDEFMALRTTLQNRVLDLEKTKTTQNSEIASLKRRVKKLEKKNRSRTHKLKRLYKVGLTARVESSDDKEILGEDPSKQGRIDDIDADEEIFLVSVHDMNVFAGEEVAEEVVKVINTAKLIIDVAQASAAGDKVSTASAATTVSAAIITTATITTVDDITLA